MTAALRDVLIPFYPWTMPDLRPPANKYRDRLMRDAAQDDMIVTITCHACRRQVHYLASDLVQVLGWDHRVRQAPWPCARCRSHESLEVRWRVRTARDHEEGVIVRRPVERVTRWRWRDEPL